MAIAWIAIGQRTPASDALLQRAVAKAFLAPALFAHEVRNALLVLERRGRIAREEIDAALIKLPTFIVLEDAPDAAMLDATLDLARTESLTVYDAAYLELTIRQGGELATKNGDLLAAARGRGIICHDAR